MTMLRSTKGRAPPKRPVFSFSSAWREYVRLGSAGDFVRFPCRLAAPKRIGLKSNRRLSEMLINPFRLRHPTFQRIFGWAKKPEGWTYARTAALRDHQIQVELRVSPSEVSSWKESRRGWFLVLPGTELKLMQLNKSVSIKVESE